MNFNDKNIAGHMLSNCTVSLFQEKLKLPTLLSVSKIPRNISEPLSSHSARVPIYLFNFRFNCNVFKFNPRVSTH